MIFFGVIITFFIKSYLKLYINSLQGAVDSDVRYLLIRKLLIERTRVQRPDWCLHLVFLLVHCPAGDLLNDSPLQEQGPTGLF